MSSSQGMDSAVANNNNTNNQQAVRGRRGRPCLTAEQKRKREDTKLGLKLEQQFNRYVKTMTKEFESYSKQQSQWNQTSCQPVILQIKKLTGALPTVSKKMKKSDTSKLTFENGEYDEEQEDHDGEEEEVDLSLLNNKLMDDRYLSHLSPQDIVERRRVAGVDEERLQERMKERTLFNAKSVAAHKARDDKLNQLTDLSREQFLSASVKASSNLRYLKAREQVITTRNSFSPGTNHQWTHKGLMDWIRDGNNNKRSNKTIATICSAFAHHHKVEHNTPLSSDQKEMLAQARKARALLVPDLPRRVGAITKDRLREVHETYDFHLKRHFIDDDQYQSLKDASTMMYACALRLFQLQQLKRTSFTFTRGGEKMYVTCKVKRTNSSSNIIELKEVHPEFLNEVKGIIKRRSKLIKNNNSGLLFFEFLSSKEQNKVTRRKRIDELHRETKEFLDFEDPKDQNGEDFDDEDNQQQELFVNENLRKLKELGDLRVKELTDELTETLERSKVIDFNSEEEDDDDDEREEDDDDDNNNNNAEEMETHDDDTVPRVRRSNKHVVDLMKLFNAETAEINLWPMAHEFHGTHNFRHGAAQDAFEEGGLELVMLRTGHESKECAKHYATHDHLRTRAVQNNLEKYNNTEEWIKDINEKMKKNAARGEILLSQDIRHLILGMSAQQQALEVEALGENMELFDIEKFRRLHLGEEITELREEASDDAQKMMVENRILLDDIRGLKQEKLLLKQENTIWRQRFLDLEGRYERLLKTYEQSNSATSTTTTTLGIRQRDQQQVMPMKQESTLEAVLKNIADNDYPRVFLVKKEWSGAIVEKYPKYSFFSAHYIENNDVVYDEVLNLSDHAKTFVSLKAGLGVWSMKWSEIQIVSQKLGSMGWKEVTRE